MYFTHSLHFASLTFIHDLSNADVDPPRFDGCPGNQIQQRYQLIPGEANAFVDLRIQAHDNSGQLLNLQVANGPAIIFPAKIAYNENYRSGQPFTYRATDPITGLSSDCHFIVRLEGKMLLYIVGTCQCTDKTCNILTNLCSNVITVVTLKILSYLNANAIWYYDMFFYRVFKTCKLGRCKLFTST